MQRGEVVLVKVYGGETLERRVVADLRKVVEICNTQEYETAVAEERSNVS